MKCWVLWLERNFGNLYKKGRYEGSSGLVKMGLFKGQTGFTIPDKAVPIMVQQRRKTIPLWIVDGRTCIALGVDEAEVDHEEAHTVKTAKGENKTVQIPVYQKKKGSIAIYPVSDPTTFVKMRILTKTSFYEALMKRLKIGLIATIIYLCAGGGLFLLGLYLIKVIFLKESTV
jgi:hypothetical protein